MEKSVRNLLWMVILLVFVSCLITFIVKEPEGVVVRLPYWFAMGLTGLTARILLLGGVLKYALYCAEGKYDNPKEGLPWQAILLINVFGCLLLGPVMMVALVFDFK